MQPYSLERITIKKEKKPKNYSPGQDEPQMLANKIEHI